METEILTPSDRARAELGLRLDTPDKANAYMAALAEKWGAAGWLNAEYAKSDKAKKFAESMQFPKLDNERDAMNMALILENQRLFQNDKEQEFEVTIDPKTGKGKGRITLDTTTTDEALPTRQVMPIVRRIYAPIFQNRFSRVQPMAGPTSYVFWLDFVREADNSNLLSLEYDSWLTAELGVPPKGKLKLTSRQITAIKNLLGVSWSTEAEEDARAVLGLNIESELMAAFRQELIRDILQRHIQDIYVAAQSATSVGYQLPGVFAGNLSAVTMPNKGSNTDTDYKQAIYASVIDADTAFYRANRTVGTDVLCGLGMAGFLQKMNTATGVSNPDNQYSSSLGIVNYGNYAARWRVQGTEFLPDNVAILYAAQPDALHASHVFAPYVPVMATPRIYGDYDASTGAYQNKDAWTRNIRERSSSIVTKPYGFQLLYGPTGGFAQW